MASIRLGSREKFELISTLTYSKALLCTIAGVSRSGYYAWKRSAQKRAEREACDQELVQKIEHALGKRIGTCGYRQATMKLRDHGHKVNHKRVARVMRIHGMQAQVRRSNPYKQLMKKSAVHHTS